MKIRQFLIIIYLLIIIMSCIMAPVCAAENIPFEPSSNVYYNNLDDYLAVSQSLNPQFSIYSKSTCNVSGNYKMHGYQTYDITTQYNTVADSDMKKYTDYILSQLNSFKYAEANMRDDSILNSFDYSITYTISTKYVSPCKYTMYVYFNYDVNFDFDTPVGSFSFNKGSSTAKDTSLFWVNIRQASQFGTYYLITNCQFKSITLTPWTILSDVNFRFPTNIITNKLVYCQNFEVEYYNNLAYSPSVNVTLDQYDLGNYIFDNFGGVIESSFDYSLNSNNLHYVTKLNDFNTASVSNSNDDIYFKFVLYKLMPLSDYEVSGGETYGTWQSKSCKTFDFVCHLGNGLGYLIYEFPLTSSITKLVAPIGEFFIKSFDFLEGFSSIGVAYGVIFTMIMISVIMFIIFGK